MSESSAHSTCRNDLDLEAFRLAKAWSYGELADFIGVTQAKQARAYALGHRWPRDAGLLNAIVEKSGGVVSIAAMHDRRSHYQSMVRMPVAPSEPERKAG